LDLRLTLVTHVSSLICVTTYVSILLHLSLFFFFTTPPPPEIYTLSLHDALPICEETLGGLGILGDHAVIGLGVWILRGAAQNPEDRKSTRLNSSHEWISYAVFCLKKKKVR